MHNARLEFNVKGELDITMDKRFRTITYNKELFFQKQQSKTKKKSVYFVRPQIFVNRIRRCDVLEVLVL